MQNGMHSEATSRTACLKTSDGNAVTLNGNALHGITACNMTIGKEGFVKGYLEQQENRIT